MKYTLQMATKFDKKINRIIEKIKKKMGKNVEIYKNDHVPPIFL